MTTGTTHADATYVPATGVKFCNDLPNPFSPDTSLNGDAGNTGVPPAQVCSEAAQPLGKGLLTSANPDITTSLDMVTGDLNFTNVVTLAPNSQVISAGDTGPIPVGAKVGGLHSETSLGTLNAPCNINFPVDFVFFNVALPNLAGAGGRVDTSTNIVWPYPEGTSVRFGHWKLGSEPDPTAADGLLTDPGGQAVVTGGFGPLVANGTTGSITNYPHHLVRAFDTDSVPADGGGDSLRPYALYGGLTKVAGTEWVPLYFAQFAAGGLAGLGTPLSGLVANMGQPSVSVLNDPTAVVASPSTITDFCTPLNVTTMLLGKTAAGDARITNPVAAGTLYYIQYNASFRDLDGDSYENALDTCPVTINAGSPRVILGGDPQNDGIDSACDPQTPSPTITPPGQTASPTPTPTPPGQTPSPTPNSFDDVDGDFFKNRQDNCPLVANGIPDSPTPILTGTPGVTGTPLPTFTPNVDSQKDSELIAAAAADKGPRTDQIGDSCDSENGTKTYIINGVSTTYVMSDTVGNGRYMSATNVVPKCIEASLPIDQDNDYSLGGGGTPTPINLRNLHGDGVCIATDGADSGVCATQSPPSCVSRHNQWTFPTPGTGGFMDTDGDKIHDALETYIGTDPVQACSGTTTTNNEPMDNWIYDLNDSENVTGQDTGQYSQASSGGFGKNIVNGPYGSPSRPGIRYDMNSDGILSGQDTGRFGGNGPYTGGTGPFNKTCTAAGIPSYIAQ